LLVTYRTQSSVPINLFLQYIFVYLQIQLGLLDILNVMLTQSRTIHVGNCQRPANIENAFDRVRVELNITILPLPESSENIPCPSRTRRLHTDPQRLRSTCPWVIETDVNENRYPKNVYNARCLCRRCIGSSSRYQCEPIYSNIIVIRLLSCHHGLLRYAQGDQLISVGCTCAHKRTRRHHT
jgi:hypothetical protein